MDPIKFQEELNRIKVLQSSAPLDTRGRSRRIILNREERIKALKELLTKKLTTEQRTQVNNLIQTPIPPHNSALLKSKNPASLSADVNRTNPASLSADVKGEEKTDEE